MLVLAFGIIFFVVLYQRRVIRHQAEINEINRKKELELVQASLKGEEDERQRIASELHDDVGATLASVKLFLHSQDKQLGDKPVFAQSRGLIDETIDKVRNLSHRLQPAVLKQFGLASALKSFFDSFRSNDGLNIEYTAADIQRLDDDTELGLYRIAQEVMNNTIKHAGAKNIRCSIEQNNGWLMLLFYHDGLGLTEESFKEQVYKKDAIGLKNIVNRLKTIDGRIRFKQDGDWHCTEISIPL